MRNSRVYTAKRDGACPHAPWFGTLPRGWEAVKCKRLFNEIDERSTDGQEELLSVSHITGVTPRSEKNVTMFQSESLVGYKICHVGDIAANTMWMWQGAIGVSSHFGVISPSYNVYRQREGKYISQYLDMLLRHPRLVDEYYSLSTGIQPSRRRLYPDRFFPILLPLPPIASQRRIVAFLDAKTAAMDRLGKIWKKEIGELEELKKAIIHRAVTGGIRGTGNGEQGMGGPQFIAADGGGRCGGGRNGRNKLRPSLETQWFGGLPDGWRLKRLKRVVRLKNEKVENSPLQYLGMENVESWTGKRIVPDEAIVPEGVCNRYSKGDVLFGKLRPYLAKVFLADTDGVCSSEFLVFVVPKDIDGRFLSFQLRSYKFIDCVNASTYGAKMPRANWDFIGNVTMPVPPLPVQREIAAYLDEKCAAIDGAIANKRKSIDELTALKSRIIADAVTGRMEVE